MRVLFDGDIFLYKACCGVQEVHTFGDLQIMVSTPEEALTRFVNRLREICNTLRVPFEDSWVAFSGSNNWRKEVFRDYKANRENTPKPMALSAAREKFVTAFAGRTIVWDRLEADDVLGILGSRNPRLILVSNDKDLCGIPGTLFQPKGRRRVGRRTSKAQADIFHALQTLTGDRVDNYKGIEGVGPVKAQALLTKLALPGEHPLVAVARAYARAGLRKNYFIQQATVARILRDGEWDFARKEHTWEPPSESLTSSVWDIESSKVKTLLPPILPATSATPGALAASSSPASPAP